MRRVKKRKFTTYNCARDIIGSDRRIFELFASLKLIHGIEKAMGFWRDVPTGIGGRRAPPNILKFARNLVKS